MFSFVVIPPAIIPVLGWVLVAALKLFFSTARREAAFQARIQNFGIEDR